MSIGSSGVGFGVALYLTEYLHGNTGTVIPIHACHVTRICAPLRTKCHLNEGQCIDLLLCLTPIPEARLVEQVPEEDQPLRPAARLECDE